MARKPRKPVPEFTGAGSVLKNEAQKALHDWIQDMVAWCAEARVDICRLEAATNLPKGDPGPPPEDPWE